MKKIILKPNEQACSKRNYSVISKVAAILICVSIFLACESKSDSAPEPTKVKKVAAAWKPPADKKVSMGKLESFLKAHNALTIIVNQYMDSLEHASEAEIPRIRQALDLAQDKAAKKFGLSGVKEYQWILSEAPKLKENRDNLKKLRVTVSM